MEWGCISFAIRDRTIEFLRWQAFWVILPSLFDDGSECRLSCRRLFTLLAFFFLTKVAGNSAISLQTKSARSHMASCLVGCRVALPIFSSVPLRYTCEMIYRDEENACDIIIAYPNYRDYIGTPVYRPPLRLTMAHSRDCHLCLTNSVFY